MKLQYLLVYRRKKRKDNPKSFRKDLAASTILLGLSGKLCRGLYPRHNIYIIFSNFAN